MWRNWNIGGLPVNELSSDSDEANYESPVDEDPHLLLSPGRPHQSPTTSPRSLLQPDPQPVEEVLAAADNQLRNLPARDARAERRNAFRAALEEAEAAAAAAQPAPEAPPFPVNMPDAVDFAVEAKEGYLLLGQHQFNNV